MNARPRSPEMLLAFINHRLEEISRAQHQLAADRAILREQATWLRMGASAEVVRVALKHAGISVLDADAKDLDGVSSWIFPRRASRDASAPGDPMAMEPWGGDSASPGAAAPPMAPSLRVCSPGVP